MINLKISTCLTIAITLILCVWGFSYKGTYTDITGEPDYLDSMLVAEIPTDIAIDECNILSNSLSQVSYILRIIPSEATEQLFGIAQQKVIVQEVYAGTDIQPGDEIYITSNHWSIYLDDGERTIGRGFVNVLDIGKEYLVFCTDTVTMPDLSIPVYRLYDQSRICPVFCYEDKHNFVIPTLAGSTYVEYYRVKDNEFFACSDEGMTAWSNLKSLMLRLYSQAK